MAIRILRNWVVSLYGSMECTLGVGGGGRKHTTNEFSMVWLLILTWIRLDFKLEYKELFTMPQFFHPWLALI